MIIELGPGNILVFLRGAAKARSLDRFVADLKGVTKSISSVMTRQPGYMGSMRLWNLDDSGDLLSIAHWDNLPERLAYEKNTSAGVRNDMETILEKTPQRPKFEVVRAANITQGEPRLARVLTATANAKSVQEFARDWAQVAPQPSLPAGGTGLLAEHVVCSIEGTAEVLVMELYANADAAQLPADQAVTLSNQCGRILRTPFASRCYAVVRTPA